MKLNGWGLYWRQYLDVTANLASCCLLLHCGKSCTFRPSPPSSASTTSTRGKPCSHSGHGKDCYRQCCCSTEMWWGVTHELAEGQRCSGRGDCHGPLEDCLQMTIKGHATSWQRAFPSHLNWCQGGERRHQEEQEIQAHCQDLRLLPLHNICYCLNNEHSCPQGCPGQGCKGGRCQQPPCGLWLFNPQLVQEGGRSRLRKVIDCEVITVYTER